MGSSLVHSGELAGDLQLHPETVHELVKAVFELSVAHPDMGGQRTAGLDRFQENF